ncbi:hypothetical protein [Microtetraspora malaysiensis]|uniref:hypothetical protein n=1 Tax=Microtetraspora malaysiensis TaxID=161358 RepID=UPI0012FA7A0F|nr:hypothetical protein [Microtetraspora malaysiensis]
MTSKAVAFVAFLLIGSGLLAGVLPVTSSGRDCGSAFVESRITSLDDVSIRLTGCKDVRNLVRIPVIVLIAAGVATLFAAGAVNAKEQREEVLRKADT